jgi:AcrR family transcriptional regulator
MTEQGLRERKKAATRAAMSRTAWALMVERGRSAVSPESVAAAADVAPRTFRYHFRNCEEAILDGLAQQHTRLADLVRQRPAGEPVWDSLLEVLPPAVSAMAGDRGEFATLMEVIAENPDMLAENLLVLERSRHLLARAIGERLGADSAADPYPGLLAGAAVTAISTAIFHWVTSESSLADLIRDYLTRLRAGLPR